MVRVRVQQKRKPGCVVGVRLQLGSQRKVRAAKKCVLRGNFGGGPKVEVLVPA